MSTEYWRRLQDAYRSRQVIWLISGLIVCTIIWAALAKLDEVIVGDGKLVPSASVQKIQSLDGGILRTLHVREGDSIVVGQLLVTLDETRAKASFAEAKAEENALQEKRLRLIAELQAIENDRIDLSMSSSLSTLTNELANFYANLNELQRRVESAEENTVQQQRELAESANSLKTYQQSLALLDDEVVLTRRAVDSGALSAAELRKLERERVRVAGQIEAEKIKADRLSSTVIESRQAKQLLFDEFRRDAQNTLGETMTRLARVEQLATGLENQLEQTRLSAAMAGTVKSIAVPSIGGVIKPGETIMEIVPANDKLVVESRIAPKDVARLRVGQEAIVKFSAYDFVIFGGLRGRLIHVSPDAITDEKGNSYFVAHVQAETTEKDENTQQAAWQDKPLIPGMQAQVDILAGKKTVLAYWLKPLLRARANAMREP